MAVITLELNVQDQALNRVGATRANKLIAGINSAYQLKIALDTFWQERAGQDTIEVVFWRDTQVLSIDGTIDDTNILVPVPEEIARGSGVFNVALQQDDLHSDSAKFEVGGIAFNPFDVPPSVSTGVASFNGRAGTVTPQSGDYTVAMISGAVESFYIGDFKFVGDVDPQTLTVYPNCPLTRKKL